MRGGTVLIITAVSLVCLPFSCGRGPYLQIYPNQDTGNGSKHLYFGLMQSFGGGFSASGTIPGVQVALDEINDDPSILPGYTLHYTLSDSQCHRGTALDGFFQQILGDTNITKIAWLGSGCSPATEPTAEISHYYNVVQVSGVSSSPELSNRERFKYYFQLCPADDELALGFFAIIRKYKWNHVAIIHQDENVFILAMTKLKMLLDEVNVTYSERRFSSDGGVAELGLDLFDSNARIYILSMYESHARDALCEAFNHGIKFPTHTLLTYMYAWYSPDWWLLGNETDHQCTAAERNSVMEYVLGPINYEFILDYSAVTHNGINGTQYNESYYEHLRQTREQLMDIPDKFEGYSVYCYDTAWAIAFALNKTLTDILTNDTLRSIAGREAGLEDPDDFGLEDFTYENRIIAEMIFKHMEETNFVGLTGRVSFDRDGIRNEALLLVRQLQYRSEDSQQLELIDIGNGTGSGVNTSFEYLGSWTDETVFPAGIPYDGVPIEEIVTVHLSLVVTYSFLAAAGITFAIVCIAFNFIFREKTLIRLTSPNLSYMIGVGGIVLYIDVCLTVVPTKDKDVVTVLCNITPWLTQLGYSLCVGTMLAKMVRVYYIFINPSAAKKSVRLSDWKLALGVLVLVTVDLVILVVYTIVEGVRGNLEADRVENMDNKMDTEGSRNVIYEYYFYTCMSTARDVTLGILYGYKAVLQVVSLILAFQIRKVKVRGLNDAKYTVAAVYVTSIVLAVIILSTYTLDEHVNTYPAVFGISLLAAATAILLLVFVPKMVTLYQDPDGKTVFPTSTQAQGDNSDTRAADSGDESDLTAAKATIDSLRKRVSQLESSMSGTQLEVQVAKSVPGDTDSNGHRKVSFCASDNHNV